MNPSSKPLFVGLLLILVLAGWVAKETNPPPARGLDEPASGFSAARALDFLERLVGDGVPHPGGSPEAALVRKRIIWELEWMGYTPVVRKSFTCTDNGACAEVRNVLARLHGQRSDSAVLLASHYDSVPAGPGASDDGVGTVVLLEVARALRLDPPPRNDVIFLFNEGEEQGLIGAQAFVDSDPWAREVAVVVNIEARGTSGTSAMFEASDQNADLIAFYSEAVPGATGSSVFQDLYDLIPNDTDLTVFKRHGMAGLNFAHAGNVERYHTPLDDVEHASPATIQHHGDAILPLTRALAATELPLPRSRNSVYFDMAGHGLARWPSEWGLPMAILALLGVCLLLGDELRRGAITLRKLLWGAAAWWFAIVLTLALGVGMTLSLQEASGTLAPWTAYPLPTRVGFWALGLIGLLAANTWLGRPAGALGAWGGAALCWAGLGLAMTALLPGAGFLLVIPLLTATLGALAGRLLWTDREGASTIAGSFCWIVVAGFFWLPMAFLFETMLGFRVGALVAGSVAVGGSGLAGLVALAERRLTARLVGAGFGIVLLACTLQLFLPSYTPDHPDHVSVMFHQDADTGVAHWRVSEWQGPVPDAMRVAGGLTEEEIPLPILPGWYIDRAASGPAESLPIPGPELKILETRSTPEGRRIRIRLRSPRGAPTVELWLPPDAEPISATIAGTHVPPNSERLLKFSKGWHRYAHLTVPPEGYEMELVLRNQEPVSAWLIEQSYDLPDSAAELVAARPPSAVPVHAGDTTILTRRIDL